MLFVIDSEWTGKTILSFLRSKIKISHSALSALKRDEKGILINGAHVTVRYVLKEGDLLSVNEKDSFFDVNDAVAPINIPLDIIFENDDIFLIDKPADMPTHPSHGHTDDTLANALSFIYSMRGDPLVFRPIGRLDRNTSGISLIAKHALSASYLYYARTHGMIRKKYIAIVEGKTPQDQDWHTIDTYMKRMEDSVIIRCIGDETEEDAFRAVTHWRTLFSGEKISVVEAIPQTGRTHQLRVHFSHIGHPILGDDIYGAKSEFISRHALHAYYLEIPLSYSDKMHSFQTLPPQDMQKAFYALTQQNLNEILKRKTNELT